MLLLFAWVAVNSKRCGIICIHSLQVFLGGSVLADIMKDKPDFWVSKREWDESGKKALEKLGLHNQT